jgi:heptosyltransferase-2
LRKERADTVVLFHHLLSRWGTMKFALLALASGARRRVGADNGRGWFLTERVPDRGFGALHEAEYWMQVVALLDAHGDLTLEAPVGEEDRRTAADLVRESGGLRCPILAIHPGTGWYGPGRRWAPESFAAVARQVRRQRDVRWIIVGSDQDAVEAARVEALLGDGVVNLTGRTSVGELAAVLEQCDVLVANDGGVAHVAAAVGTPVVAVFGPSNDRAWRPLTGSVVAAQLPCRPCFYRDHRTGSRTGCATRECLSLVTPAMVASAVLEAMEDPHLAMAKN